MNRLQDNTVWFTENYLSINNGFRISCKLYDQTGHFFIQFIKRFGHSCSKNIMKTKTKHLTNMIDESDLNGCVWLPWLLYKEMIG